MNGYWQIALIIITSGVVSGFLYAGKSKETVKGSLLFTGLYFYVISAFRMFQGHGSELLGQAFADKGVSGYLKVAALVIVSGACVLLVKKFKFNFFIRWFEVAIQIFWAFSLLAVFCVNLPGLRFTFFTGIAAIAVSLAVVLLKKDKDTSGEKVEVMPVMASLAAWVMVFLINGPTEIYAYSAQDFPFRFKDFFGHTAVAAVFLMVLTFLLAKYLWNRRITFIVNAIVLIYTALAYIQTMFLNRDKLNVMEGATQDFPKATLWTNIAVWTVVAVIVAVLFILKGKKARKLGTYAAGLIAALQLLSVVSLVVSGGLMGEHKAQLNERDMFSMNSDNNVVVFILDTYDKQMVEYVSNEYPDYLEGMKDFTYYENMVSRFDYTDGSLPYLLTGILKDEYSPQEYKDSSFLKTIKDYGYDIKALTSGKYIENFDEGIVSNCSDDWFMEMEHGKTVRQMINCTRYRANPFALKSYYSYADFNLVGCVKNSDVYFFGTDAEFYGKLCNSGLNTDNADSGAFRLYHLYGAHMPYYLKEDMTYDYVNQDPMAQWKASVKIVDEYIADMKDAGIYDGSTIIIMGDHGPGPKQRTALSALGVEFGDELHPIFFVKRPMEAHERYVIDERPVSHDEFCATIIKSIDENNDSFGEAVWEK